MGSRCCLSWHARIGRGIFGTSNIRDRLSITAMKFHHDAADFEAFQFAKAKQALLWAANSLFLNGHKEVFCQLETVRSSSKISKTGRVSSKSNWALRMIDACPFDPVALPPFAIRMVSKRILLVCNFNGASFLKNQVMKIPEQRLSPQLKVPCKRGRQVFVLHLHNLNDEVPKT